MSNSRFSHTQIIFITDKKHAFDAMARFEERPLASEVIKQPASEMPKQQKKEKTAIKVTEKMDQQIKQKSSESLDWTPGSSKIGMRL